MYKVIEAQIVACELWQVEVYCGGGKYIYLDFKCKCKKTALNRAYKIIDEANAKEQSEQIVLSHSFTR